MTKSLKDILDGKKASKIVPGSTGTNPGVDYDPKAGDEQKFVRKHSTEKHDDRVGNGDDIYQATNVKKISNKISNKGHDKGEDEKVYENTSNWSKQDHVDYHQGRHERAVAALMRNPKDKGMERTADIEHGARKALKKLGVMVQKPKHPSVFESKETEELKCNESPAGIYCPVHGKKECSKQLRERNVTESYKMTYEKGVKDSNSPTGLTRHVVHTSIHLPGVSSSDSPHKIRRDVQNSDKHKQMINKGYNIHKYGEHHNLDTSSHPVKIVKEDLAVPLLGGADIAKHKTDNVDDEIDMVKTELKSIANKAAHLLMAMPENVHIEPWVQSKIAQAKALITDIHDYMVYGDHESTEDEQTAPYDGGIEVPPSSGMVPGTFPSFSADVNTGRNV